MEACSTQSQNISNKIKKDSYFRNPILREKILKETTNLLSMNLQVEKRMTTKMIGE